MEFVNTFSQTDTPPAFFDPLAATFWGAGFDRDYHGPGYRYRLVDDPNAAMRPVAGVSWRMAALYCNWLHNGKQSDPSSLATGAYDTTTWGPAPGGGFTDAWTHLPGAQFWIPTLDEAMKSQHYDPNRDGPGQGGWWFNKNGSDDPGIPGPPGMGTTSAGYDDGTAFGVWSIPLGAYPDSQSPWGLLDTSGGTQEWTEDVAFNGIRPTERRHFGSFAGPDSSPFWDYTYGFGSADAANQHPHVGFRIMSVVPSPHPAAAVLVVSLFICASRRRVRS
jgi:hypothetical protein